MFKKFQTCCLQFFPPCSYRNFLKLSLIHTQCLFQKFTVDLYILFCEDIYADITTLLKINNFCFFREIKNYAQIIYFLLKHFGTQYFTEIYMLNIISLEHIETLKYSNLSSLSCFQLIVRFEVYFPSHLNPISHRKKTIS